MYVNRIIFAHLRKSGPRNTMVTSDFRLEIEIWPYRACAMKNMQYNCYYKNSLVIVDLAMEQIPRSTECISSFLLNQLTTGISVV